ncbi:MAG: site-2 protease family protein [Planctomycetaceae bacterium]|nr:site-2 protease family protein [Planctomycetaceae bacterium]
MRDLLSWNLYLGRWWGVQVRLHVFFLLFAVFAVPTRAAEADGSWYPLAALGLLFASVLLHEIGHCTLARLLGSSPDQIMLWPLGGLVPVCPSQDPQREWMTALGGPLFNFLACLVLAPILLMSNHASLLRFALPPVTAGDAFSWPLLIALAFWLNWMLAVVNLLPAMPLDGGRFLRAVLWQRFDYRSAVLQVAWAAKFTAFALLVAGWWLSGQYPFVWVGFALFALLLWFSARQDTEKALDQDTDDAEFAYDFSQGYTSLERTVETSRKPRPGLLRQWIDQRRDEKQRRQRELEQQEDLRMDDVLARLHKVGVERLSPEDRALLERVSNRYRNRERHS